jgi:serine/threonine protein kinase
MADELNLGPNVRLTVKEGAGARLLRLAGVIDEKFDREGLLRRAQGTPALVLDLDGITRITSFGVREWIRCLDELSNETYYFIQARPVMASQFGTVSHFGGRGTVVSVYAPYLCGNCDHDFDVLLDLRSQYQVVVDGEPPAATCPKCGNADGVEFDELAETYFAPFASAPRPSPPKNVSALIDSASSAPTVLRVLKEVDGRVTALWIAGRIDKAVRFKRLGSGLEGQVIVIDNGISAVTDDGFLGLKTFLETTEADLYLGRVGQALLRTLRNNRVDRARVVSFGLPYRCTACGMPSQLELSTEGLGAEQCIECGKGPLTPELDISLVNSMKGALVAAPPPVSAYLKLNRVAPVHTHGGRGSPAPAPSVESAPASSEGMGRALGKYAILRRIGVGGMAEVFLGTHSGPEGFKKKVVIKRILPHLEASPEFVEMFLQEARLAAQISSPHVVQTFDLGKDGPHYYMVMEYVPGADLNVVLRLSRALKRLVPVGLACRIICGVCAGLHAAHNCEDDDGNVRHIIHRDVSPHNVLISTNGHVKISDFGVAKAQGSGATRTGSLKGKVVYMPPEQILGEELDERADIYAAGLVLYVTLTGVNPFHRSTEPLSLYAVLREDVPDLRQVRPEVPDELAFIVQRAIARERDHRIGSASELQLALEGFLAGAQLSATETHLAVWMRELTRDAISAGILGAGDGVESKVADRPANQTNPGGDAKTQVVRTSGERPVFSDDVEPFDLFGRLPTAD